MSPARGAGRFPTRHVRSGLALATVVHGLVDVATTAGRRSGLLEALVLTAPPEHLDAGIDPGTEVEHDRVVRVADEHGVTLGRPELEQSGLDPQPVQPVGQEAHGFVIAEVGLPDPSLGLDARDLPGALS